MCSKYALSKYTINKRKTGILFALTLAFLLFFMCNAGTVFADEERMPDNIAFDGKTVSLDSNQDNVFYFTADRDGGYTFTITAPNCMAPIVNIEQYHDFSGDENLMGDTEFYFNLYDPMGFEIRDYPDATYTRDNICSIYCAKGVSYRATITFQVLDEQGGTPALKLTHSDKAGITGSGFEYWSSNDSEDGKEIAKLVEYYGSGKVMNVPGSIDGMQVRFLDLGFLSDDPEVTKITFGEGIKIFGNNIAENCPNLKQVELPSTLIEIANKPFLNSKLDSIAFPNGNANYSYKDKYLILDGTNVIGYYGAGTETHVPDGILLVESKVFAGSDVETVYLPESVKEFRYQYKHITEIHTPGSFLDISDIKDISDDDPEQYPIDIDRIYGPSGSQIEEAATRYGIEFIPEGTAKQYYEIKELKTNEINGDLASRIYRHRDNAFYGVFTPAKSGRYCLIAEYNSDSSRAVMDSITDASGKTVKQEPFSRNYDGVMISLEAGKTYYFKDNGYEGDLESELYMPQAVMVYLIREDIMYPDEGGEDSEGGEDYGYEDGDRKAQPMTAKGKTVKISFRKLKKKAKAITAKKAYRVKKAKGKLSFKLSSAKKGKKNFKKYFKVSKKTGKITIKKGLKRGKYKIRVRIKAAGNSDYNAGKKTVTVTVKVR